MSRQTFNQLRIKSRGYKYRLIPSAKDRWLEKGEPKKFSGIIVRPPTAEEWGELSSTDPLIPFPIPVRPIDMKYERYSRLNKVKFEIVFNMTGPQASNVTER